MDHRPLSGHLIGISISGDDISKRGLLEDELNGITVELCRRFVALGASVALGHQWRPNGIMDGVTSFARGYFPPSGTDRFVVYNFLAWPNKSALSPVDLEELRKGGLLHVREVPKAHDKPSSYRVMREEMADKITAQVCIGGKLEQPDNTWVSGVLEEAVLCARRGKPVFVSSMLGGMSEVMIDVARGRLTLEKGLARSTTSDEPLMREYLGDIAKILEERARDSWPLDKAALEELERAENLDTIVHAVAQGLAHAKR